MSLLIFQNSRRHLLQLLMHQAELASRHREEHQARGEAESASERVRIDNLNKAVEAAENEVTRLEYWSDIRRITREGGAPGSVNNRAVSPVHEWQGLDASGPGAHDISTAKEPGHSKASAVDQSFLNGASTTPRQGTTHQTRSEEPLANVRREDLNTATASSDEAYTTAEERPKDKGKGKAL